MVKKCTVHEKYWGGCSTLCIAKVMKIRSHRLSKKQPRVSQFVCPKYFTFSPPSKLERMFIAVDGNGFEVDMRHTVLADRNFRKQKTNGRSSMSEIC
jgi:hypothetical protein